MPETKPKANPPTSHLSTTEPGQPIAEPKVSPIFWVMGVIFAVLLGIIFFVINALSVFP